MKLWILKARKDLPEDDNPWKPWYDKNFGLVVRAATEEQARKLATQFSGDESRDGKTPWLSTRYSTCEELTNDGEAGVLLIDHHAA